MSNDLFMFSVELPIEAKGKARARVFYDAKEKKYRGSTPAATKKQSRDIKLLAKAEMSKRRLQPTNQALIVQIEIVYAPRKGYSKVVTERMATGKMFHTVKPDIDNITKLILDALNKIVWYDDCQIVSLMVTKRYGKESRVKVSVGQDIMAYD